MSSSSVHRNQSNLINALLVLPLGDAATRFGPSNRNVSTVPEAKMFHQLKSTWQLGTLKAMYIINPINNNPSSQVGDRLRCTEYVPSNPPLIPHPHNTILHMCTHRAFQHIIFFIRYSFYIHSAAFLGLLFFFFCRHTHLTRA